MNDTRLLEPNILIHNRYRVVQTIGQGGMGAVYEATDENLGQVVALKQQLLPPDTPSDVQKQLNQAFEQEAKTLAGLRHGALPRVTDHFVEGTQQFLVMDFVQGDDLETLLQRRNAPFDVAEVLNWADQILDALAYLHENDIIHRDISPDNLRQTPTRQIMLLDFGIAKSGTATTTQAVQGSVRFGKQGYASPEQVDGSGTEPRSDLYSLAATLYALLTNTHPIDASSRAIQMAKTKQDPQDPLCPAHEANAAVPEGVSCVLQQALSIDLESRPASAAEMRSRLKDAQQRRVAVITTPFVRPKPKKSLKEKFYILLTFTFPIPKKIVIGVVAIFIVSIFGFILFTAFASKDDTVIELEPTNQTKTVLHTTVVSGTTKIPIYAPFTLPKNMATNYTKGVRFLVSLFGDSISWPSEYEAYAEAYSRNTKNPIESCHSGDVWRCIDPKHEMPNMLPMYPWLALDGTSTSSAESGGGFTLQVGAEIYHIEGHETINSQIVTDSHVVVIGTVAHATDSVNNWEQSGNWKNLQRLDGHIMVKPIFVRYDNGNWLMMNEQTEQNLLNRPVWLYSNHAPLLNELVEDKTVLANHETVLVHGMWSPNHVTPQLVVTAVYAFDDASQSYRCVASPGRPSAACP